MPWKILYKLQYILCHIFIKNIYYLSVAVLFDQKKSINTFSDVKNPIQNIRRLHKFKYICLKARNKKKLPFYDKRREEDLNNRMDAFYEWATGFRKVDLFWM